MRSLFRPNAEKYKPEKLCIRTLFTVHKDTFAVSKDWLPSGLDFDTGPSSEM